MKLTLTINADNESFGENQEDKALETASVLTQLVAKLKHGEFLPSNRQTPLKLKDAHGNTVGFAAWEDE